MSQLPIGDDASPEDEAAQGTGPPSEGPQGEHEQGEHELSYERASGRIEEIIHRLDSGEAGLRETLELVAEGRRLVEFCATELEAVGRGLEELRLDELVARLERGDDGRPTPPSP
ncbi:MAG: Exonuclease small subunit [Conexibacter sp.]|nr:Exonuclease small subunit [Conexibacter sp.]